MAEIRVIGGGLAGLVAAITAAEAGARVTLFEASGRLGGRASTREGLHRTNLGPHALYFGGPMEAWLRQRSLLPDTRVPRTSAVRMLWRGRLRRVPSMLLPMLRSLRHEAPVDLDYRSFLRRHVSERGADAAIGFASLPSFHPDPGSLSAAFVQERLRRSLQRPAVGYILGGWATLVGALAARGGELGVRVSLGEKLPALVREPGVKTIVATDLPTARKLLDDPSLDGPCARQAVFDVALRRKRRDPRGVLDLDRRVYVSDYAAVDASLAPRGESLIQCVAGLHAGEGLREGLARIEAVLDRCYRDWKRRATHQHKGLMDGGTGAVDLPGTQWRDRPAIDRGDDVWLAGDRVAAPGLLSEVSVVSAVRAACAATGRDAEL